MGMLNDSKEFLSGEALILLSGGIDSAACTHFYLTQGFSVQTLFVNYGQKAKNQEIEAAQGVADFLQVPFKKIDLEGISCSFEGEIVGRNSFLLFTALMEFQHKGGVIGVGVHSDTPYYDCSIEFIKSVQDLYDGYTGGRIKVGVPFIQWTKSDIWKYFIKSKIPFELTYSCENGLTTPCGKCLSCKDLEMLGAYEKDKNLS